MSVTTRERLGHGGRWVLGVVVMGAIAAAGCGHGHHDDDYRAGPSGYYDRGEYHGDHYDHERDRDRDRHDYDDHHDHY